MEDGTATTSEQATLLRTALQSHGEYLRAACQGKGCDRHLLGLRVEAMKVRRREKKKIYLFFIPGGGRIYNLLPITHSC